jgi:anti-anti-sigma factor
MDTVTNMVEVKLEGDTLEVIPNRDLRELDFPQIEAEGEVLLRLVDEPTIRNLVVDFGRTDYFGSTAVGLLAQLGRHVRDRGGHMALCNLSPHEQEILEVTHLAGQWPTYRSRAEAVAAVTCQTAA